MLIVSCDLFNGTVQPDFLKNIDEEIRWANAAKLNVRIDYPSEWGVSSPSAGQISPSPRDIRQGYPFELEFTPDTAYSFQGWRAYDTSTLNALEGDWRLDLTLLEEVPQLSGVEIPTLPARGGTGSFTISTVTPVTLVPFCKTEPYVIRTDPRTEARTSTTMRTYHPSTPVTFYFNAALDPNIPWDFGNGRVGIKARSINDIATDGDFSDHNEWFDRIEYDSKAGQHTVTVYPKAGTAGPSADYQIEITIGPNISNAQGEPMTSTEVLYYKVSEIENAKADITGWSAAYNDNGTITVTCNIGGANAAEATATAYYQMNQSSNQPFTLNKNGNSFTGTITGVTSLDANGIREGRQVSNTREYRIFIELNADGYTVDDANFKIWNFPGMGVAKNATTDTSAIEIRQSAELANIHTTGLDRQYVLANDITVTDHTPIGNGSGAAAFTGNFYGNGHTVTINGINAAADMGLFGVANNALIRDLTVQHYNEDVTGTNSEARFGGIAGTATGSARIENVLVEGAATLNIESDIPAYAGGIVGIMTGTSSISNAYSGLDLTVNKNINGGSNRLYVGGVVGSMGTASQSVLWRGDNNGNWQGISGGGGDPVTVEKASVVGHITVGSEDNPVSTWNEFSNSNSLFVGGLAGSIRGSGDNTRAKLDNSKYSQGTIRVFSGGGTTRVGGAIGIASQYADIYECSGNAEELKVSMLRGSAYLFMGGFIGDIRGYSRAENCSSENPIVAHSEGNYQGDIMAGGFSACIDGNSTVSYCYAKGDVSVLGYTLAYVGGFAGRINNNGNAEYCYATGDVSALIDLQIKYELPSYAGGFSGTSYSLSNCYALGNVLLDRIVNRSGTEYTAQLFAGALIGEVLGNGNTIEYCFAAGSVTIQRYPDNEKMYAGGLVGSLGSNTLKNSAALGASVICTGGGSTADCRNVGRVCGGTTGTLQNNNAYSGMSLYESGTYKAPSPTRVNPLVPAQAHNNKNGKDVIDGDFRRRDIWQNESTANPTLPIHGLGFSGDHWIFAIVGYLGHPILKGEDGKALGGQQ